MNQYDYAYGVAYIRTAENHLLTSRDFDNLLSIKTPEEAIRLLADKYSLDEVAVKNYDELLLLESEKAWTEVNYALPRGVTLDFLIYKNDFHNLKVALKGVLSGVKDYDKYILTPSTIPFEIILNSIETTEFNKLPEMLSLVAQNAYDVLSRTGDSQLSDTLVDKALMDFLFKSALKTKNKFLIEYVKLQNTLTNIKIALRCLRTLKTSEYMDMAFSDNSHLSRNRLISSILLGIDDFRRFLKDSGYETISERIGDSGTQLEKLLDDMITDYLKNSSYVSFGVEPLIYYFNRKQTEILNVRIILSGKINGFSEDDLQERLRSY